MENVRKPPTFTLLLFVVGYCCAASTNRQLLQWNDGCRTPNGDPGVCTVIKSCQPMINFLATSGSTLDSKAKELLRRYICGYEDSGAKVCCPNKPITLTSNSGSTGDDELPNRNLIPTECGISRSEARITNGNLTDLFEFPWQVALKYESSKVIPYHCGGSLINNRYVLTAAHCIQTKLKLVGVRLGEYDFNSDTDCVKYMEGERCAPSPVDFDITTADVTVHPQYSKTTLQNDIALIRLPRQVEFTDSVGPVCLPIKQEFLVSKFRTLTVTGWGTTENGRSSTILLKVNVPYVQNDQCNSVFRNQISISEKQICAGGKDGKDSCTGDSGGPIMYSVNDDGIIRWVQAGLVSFGTKKCGLETVPAVYTRLTSYIDWIYDNIRP